MPRAIVFGCLLLVFGANASSSFGDDSLERLNKYFALETEKVQSESLLEIETLEQWQKKREAYREELYEMLGLSAMPAKSKLDVKVTSVFEADGIIVEKLHFQSIPGLYVTANLYRPAEQSERLPAILYVCGHGRVKEDGVSYGNKVHYHHHGCWFARNGYVCLTIDTLQLGEIEGIHHGTYRYDRWWWLNRGYTPAGVEAWNCIRALDFLETRAEVDAERIGVTGRSGGGAYSWWIAALDERIKCAVPVAGITDLQNHVVDGCVEGHCDCMYFVNTYRWDYDKVAALVAPRPLLISNTDSDGIFPLDGVHRLFKKTRRIYELYGAGADLGLNITAGGHKDTQELRVHAFRWFNKHLKQKDELISDVANKQFSPSQLKVLSEAPKDEINTRVDEVFVADADANLRSTFGSTSHEQLTAALLQKSFAGWPENEMGLGMQQLMTAEFDGLEFSKWKFQSQEFVDLELFLVRRVTAEPTKRVILNVMGEADWDGFCSTYSEAFPVAFETAIETSDLEQFQKATKGIKSSSLALAYVAPRGVGPAKYSVDDKKLTQIRRRFYLLGQSLDGMQVYDIRRAIQCTKKLPGLRNSELCLTGTGKMAGKVTYASLFEDGIRKLELHQPCRDHDAGPYFLNIDRISSFAETIYWASRRSKVVIYDENNVKAWQTVSSKRAKIQEGGFEVRLPVLAE